MKKFLFLLKKLFLNYRKIEKNKLKIPVEPWAFIRVKNEIDTIEACLNSIKSVIKKGVIGYHQLAEGEKDDGTEEFIKKFCKENKGYILFKYPYEVIPANDDRYRELDKIKKENRLDSYYQAVLDCIPKNEWLIKIDCDHIYDTEKLQQLMYLPKKDTDVISFSRFNLHYMDEKLYVFKNNTIINPIDHWLMKNNDIKFSFKSGYQNGIFFAWELINLSEKIKKKEVTVYDTNLFNYHFPMLKYRRRDTLKKEDLIPFKDWKIPILKKLQFHVTDDMLDENKILEICKKFKM